MEEGRFLRGTLRAKLKSVDGRRRLSFVLVAGCFARKWDGDGEGGGIGGMEAKKCLQFLGAAQDNYLRFVMTGFVLDELITF